MSVRQPMPRSLAGRAGMVGVPKNDHMHVCVAHLPRVLANDFLLVLLQDAELLVSGAQLHREASNVVDP